MAVALMITVELGGEWKSLPAHIAADEMVKAYGENVYQQEVAGLKSAFSRFWHEVDEQLAQAIGDEALRSRLTAIVGEGRIPAAEMMKLVREYEAMGESEGEADA